MDIDNHLLNSNQPVVIAVDSSGIKVTNRGDWIRKKRNGVISSKRGWIKLHLAVDTKTKQVLSMEVTEEDVHDTRMLKPLVESSLRVAKVRRTIGDGSYDSRSNFRFLSDKGIDPVIKVRKNSVAKTWGCYARKVAVQEQQGNYKKWSKKKGYGYRWMAESALSSIKGRLGEYVRAKKVENMIQEVKLKVFTYNWLIRGMPFSMKGIV